jgi:hypothetical protein
MQAGACNCRRVLRLWIALVDPVARAYRPCLALCRMFSCPAGLEPGIADESYRRFTNELPNSSMPSCGDSRLFTDRSGDRSYICYSLTPKKLGRRGPLRSGTRGTSTIGRTRRRMKPPREVTRTQSVMLGHASAESPRDEEADAAPRPTAATARACLSLLGKHAAAAAAIGYENSCLHSWIALHARFRTMPPSRTALLMIIALFGRSPFCRTSVEESLGGTGEGSIVTVFS